MKYKPKRDNGTRLGIGVTAVLLFLFLIVIGVIVLKNIADSNSPKRVVVPANKFVTPDRVKATSGATGDTTPSSSGVNPTGSGSNSQLSN